MQAVFATPGVYRQETAPAPLPRLRTGVPGFVGLALPAAGVLLLTKPEDLSQLQIEDPSTSYLAAAVQGFFANGGSRCLVAAVDPALDAIDCENATTAALDRLAERDDLDLIALPDVSRLPLLAARRVQAYALAQCKQLGDRIAILDAEPAATTSTVQVQLGSLLQGLGDVVNGALYYPWIALTPGRHVPPCGHVAGIIAATDAAVGVFKAPANVVITEAIDLQTLLDDRAQGELNTLGINCLRALPGRGIRVWGARTLSRDPDWRYLSVRRLFLTLNRWIDLNLGWVVFEPNGAPLWARIERELGGYLAGLWRAGALFGDQADEAFYVRCNATNNPYASRDAGLLIVEIGLAPSQPAEFLTVRINLLATEPDGP